ncbi:hypothetical protein FA15DRAFT_730819 [Coprinopsis marcescibilis]|uniref:Uncharacterized protein n=1 Tax=Coprinopsis marcescibilis TaxID=230819 RepID=A0A5C3KE12_COPMA|nr:hypothetical protein FA15DRAFT_730819 [Coprinopsis marcescibilis]
MPPVPEAGVVVGAVIGTLAILGLVLGLGLLYWKRRGRTGSWSSKDLAWRDKFTTAPEMLEKKHTHERKGSLRSQTAYTPRTTPPKPPHPDPNHARHPKPKYKHPRPKPDPTTKLTLSTASLNPHHNPHHPNIGPVPKPQRPAPAGNYEPQYSLGLSSATIKFSDEHSKFETIPLTPRAFSPRVNSPLGKFNLIPRASPRRTLFAERYYHARSISYTGSPRAPEGYI